MFIIVHHRGKYSTSRAGMQYKTAAVAPHFMHKQGFENSILALLSPRLVRVVSAASDFVSVALMKKNLCVPFLQNKNCPRIIRINTKRQYLMVDLRINYRQV